MRFLIKHTQWLLLGAILFFGVCVCGAVQAQESSPIFRELHWHNRALVLVGPEDNLSYIEQVALLREAFDGLEAREIVVLHFDYGVLEKVAGLSPFPFYDQALESSDENRYLASRLRVRSGVFAVALVSLDGELVQVWTQIVDPAEIFDVIDGAEEER